MTCTVFNSQRAWAPRANHKQAHRAIRTLWSCERASLPSTRRDTFSAPPNHILYHPVGPLSSAPFRRAARKRFRSKPSRNRCSAAGRSPRTGNERRTIPGQNPFVNHFFYIIFLRFAPAYVFRTLARTSVGPPPPSGGAPFDNELGRCAKIEARHLFRRGAVCAAGGSHGQEGQGLGPIACDVPKAGTS